MRRSTLGLAALVATAALAGCGSTGLSYSDGYGVGQSLAATLSAPEVHAHAPSICARQWTVSGPTSDQRRSWIHGCVVGMRTLERTIGG